MAVEQVVVQHDVGVGVEAVVADDDNKVKVGADEISGAGGGASFVVDDVGGHSDEVVVVHAAVAAHVVPSVAEDEVDTFVRAG